MSILSKYIGRRSPQRVGRASFTLWKKRQFSIDAALPFPEHPSDQTTHASPILQFTKGEHRSLYAFNLSVLSSYSHESHHCGSASRHIWKPALAGSFGTAQFRWTIRVPPSGNTRSTRAHRRFWLGASLNAP